MRVFACVASVMVLAGCMFFLEGGSVKGADLPPEILVEQYLLELEMAVAEDKHSEAVAVIEKLKGLESAIELPPEIDFHYAMSLNKAGRREEAYTVLIAYLQNPDLDRDTLQPALKLKIELEQTRKREESFKSAPEFLDLKLSSNVSLRLKKIPPGLFIMGSPENAKDRISDDEAERSGSFGSERQQKMVVPEHYYIGLYEVSEAQYQAVLKERPSKAGPNYPVENMTWHDANRFCREASKITGRKVRLPTEVEWEYACRAGTTTIYNTGDRLLSSQASFSKDGSIRDLLPVGSFPPNSWGLYDMHGSVWEYTSDNFTRYGYGVAPHPEDRNKVTIRGGGVSMLPGLCTSATRYGHSNEENRCYQNGFRVVVE